jgi:hypothetical protein
MILLNVIRPVYGLASIARRRHAGEGRSKGTRCSGCGDDSEEKVRSDVVIAGVWISWYAVEAIFERVLPFDFIDRKSMVAGAIELAVANLRAARGT